MSDKTTAPLLLCKCMSCGDRFECFYAANLCPRCVKKPSMRHARVHCWENQNER